MKKSNVQWSENFYFPGHNRTIEFNADSYNKWVREVAPYIPSQYLTNNAFEKWTQAIPIDRVSRKIKRIIAKKTGASFIAPSPTIHGKHDIGGGWTVGVRTLPYYQWGTLDWMQSGLKRHRLSIYEETHWDCYAKGAVMFTGPVHIPVLIGAGGNPWMSLTPNEVITLRDGVKWAQGNTLIAGLGMGWFTERVLQSSKVNHVTQVELDPDIINFFGGPLKEKYGDRIEFVQADIYDYLKMVDINNFDSAEFDIWPSLIDAYHDEDFQAIKDSHNGGLVWGWGDVEGVCDNEDFDDEEIDPDVDQEFDNDEITDFQDEPWEWWGLD